MLPPFRGNLDNWDPAPTDALAAEREVILADYPGALIPDVRIRIYSDSTHGNNRHVSFDRDLPRQFRHVGHPAG